jgi:hypothetical protein
MQVGQHTVRNIAMGGIATEEITAPDPEHPDAVRVVITTKSPAECIFFFAAREVAEKAVADIKAAKTTFEEVRIKLVPALNQHLLHPNDRS